MCMKNILLEQTFTVRTKHTPSSYTIGKGGGLEQRVEVSGITDFSHTISSCCDLLWLDVSVCV